VDFLPRKAGEEGGSQNEGGVAVIFTLPAKREKRQNSCRSMSGERGERQIRGENQGLLYLLSGEGRKKRAEGYPYRTTRKLDESAEGKREDKADLRHLFSPPD